MSHTNNYYIIKKYSEIVPDYPLFFNFAKHNKLWKYIYPLHKYDAFQIVALAALTPGTTKEKNRLLQKEIYYFYSHVIISVKPDKRKNQNTKIYKKYKPDFLNHCNICNKDKFQYMYKSFIPDKTVCSACIRRLKRSDKKNAN